MRQSLLSSHSGSKYPGMEKSTQQRFLQLGLSLPAGATDRTLERALERWNGHQSDKTLATRMSELRLLTDPVVRRNLRAIERYASEAADGDGKKYKNAFLSACVRIKRDGKL